jgi:hypothetical protein
MNALAIDIEDDDVTMHVLPSDNWVNNWIGCGKVYKDVPGFIPQTFNQIQTIPTAMRGSALPDTNKPVTEFL